MRPRLRAFGGLPKPCEVCRQWIEAGPALCTDCSARFGAMRPRCQRCGLRLGLAAPACGDCLRDPPAFDRTVCVADYEFPWDHLIADFKFNARPEIAPLLAERLVDTLRRAAAPLPELVLPVPLAPLRLAARGYNQAWELARRVAAPLGLDADCTLLQRPVDTRPQAELDRRARRNNLRLAFMVDPRRRGLLQGRRLALVDDVMTSGATLHHAALVLQRAGAASVQAWVIARTPAH